jgi:hypothetical protein
MIICRTETARAKKRFWPPRRFPGSGFGRSGIGKHPIALSFLNDRIDAYKNLNTREPVSRLFRIIAMTALLKAGSSAGAECTETNTMPAEIHTLMETKGYVINSNSLYSPQNTNSLRNYPLIEWSQLRRLEPPTKKVGWSFWENTKIKYVDKNTGTATEPAPTSLSHFLSPSQFEYDIYYPFQF